MEQFFNTGRVGQVNLVRPAPPPDTFIHTHILAIILGTCVYLLTFTVGAVP